MNLKPTAQDFRRLFEAKRIEFNRLPQWYAYEQAEAVYFEKFGLNRYADFDSFRATLQKVLKREREHATARQTH